MIVDNSPLTACASAVFKFPRPSLIFLGSPLKFSPFGLLLGWASRDPARRGLIEPVGEGVAVALGRRNAERQGELWVAPQDLFRKTCLGRRVRPFRLGAE